MAVDRSDILHRLEHTIGQWNDEVTSAHESLTAQIAEAKNQLSVLLSLLDGGREGGHSANGGSGLLAEIDRLRSELAEKERQTTQLSQTIMSLKRGAAEHSGPLESKIDALVEQGAANRESIETIQRVLSETNGRAPETDSAAVDEGASETVLDELRALRQKIDELTASPPAHPPQHNDIAELRADIQALRETLNGSQPAAPDSDAGELLKRADLITGKLDSLQNEIQELRSDFRVDDSVDDAAESHLSQLRDVISALQAPGEENLDLDPSEFDVEAEHESHATDPGAHSGEHASKTNGGADAAKMKELEETIAQLRAELELARAQRAPDFSETETARRFDGGSFDQASDPNLDRRLKELGKIIENLEDREVRTREAWDRAAREKIEIQARLQEESERSRQENEKLRSTIDELEQALADGRGNGHRALTDEERNALAEAQAELDALHRELTEKNADAETARIEIERLYELLDEQGGESTEHLKEELRAAERNLELAEIEIRDLHAKVDTLLKANATIRVAPDAASDLEQNRIELAGRDPANRRRVMGEILVHAGILTPRQLDRALTEQRANPQRRLGTILVDMGFTTEEIIARTLASQLRMPFMRLCDARLDGQAVSKLDGKAAIRHLCIPLGVIEGKLVVAMANPLDTAALEELESKTGMPLEPVVSTMAEITAAIVLHYGVSDTL